jgi:carboxyl-terminal processing protease
VVFGCVLAVGAATGAFGGEAGKASAGRERSSAGTGGTAGAVGSPEIAEAAAVRASAQGASVAAADRDVSRSGDRWNAVYSAREYQEFRQALDGEYVGVGLWVRSGPGGRIEVARAQPGSPADRAGIRAGDRMRTIDGEKVEGQPVTEVVARLRGGRADGESAAPGTPVVLGLERGTRAWRETLHRTRLSVRAVTVERCPAEHASRITVETFTKGTGEKVRRAVRDVPAGDGILLDLRGNSGGLVSEAVVAASAFLDGGLVATYDMYGRQRALYAEAGGNAGSPLVVLVDSGTMSAAELLAGALQERGRAVVVGSRTFGKGSVQMPTELPDGSVAELTVGHYRTPGGRTVDGRGITPDLAVRGRAEERGRRVLRGLGTGM